MLVLVLAIAGLQPRPARAAPAALVAARARALGVASSSVYVVRDRLLEQVLHGGEEQGLTPDGLAAGPRRRVRRELRRDRRGIAVRRGADVPRARLLAARAVRALAGDRRGRRRCSALAHGLVRVAARARALRLRARLAPRRDRQRRPRDPPARPVQRRRARRRRRHPAARFAAVRASPSSCSSCSSSRAARGATRAACRSTSRRRARRGAAARRPSPPTCAVATVPLELRRRRPIGTRAARCTHIFRARPLLPDADHRRGAEAARPGRPSIALTRRPAPRRARYGRRVTLRATGDAERSR